jgi:hypothetical protein
VASVGVTSPCRLETTADDIVAGLEDWHRRTGISDWDGLSRGLGGACPSVPAARREEAVAWVMGDVSAAEGRAVRTIRPQLVEALIDTDPGRRERQVLELLTAERDRVDSVRRRLLWNGLRILESMGFGEEVVSGGDLLESPIGSPAFNDDGSLNIVILRPCVGRGPASAIYRSEMLASHAGLFADLPMFRGHAPRGEAELAGMVLESRFDPEFETPRDARLGFDRGAVVGRAEVTDAMADELRAAPGSWEISPWVHATSWRPVAGVGFAGLLVEGLTADPERHSVDFVPLAGAGGEVLAEATA